MENDKNMLIDKEFYKWAFGSDSMTITLESLEQALNKLYEIYIKEKSNEKDKSDGN